MKTEDVELEFVCPKRDDELRGNGRRLYCDECDHEVTVLSEMTAREARGFLEAARTGDQRVCVAYDSDDSGEILFLSERLKLQLAGAASLLATATLVAVSVSSAFSSPSAPPPAPAWMLTDRPPPPPSPTGSAMESVDPNAAFDRWEYVGNDWEDAALAGAQAIDLTELRILQDQRNRRTSPNRRKGKIKRTKGVTKKVLDDTIRELEAIQAGRDE